MSWFNLKPFKVDLDDNEIKDLLYVILLTETVSKEKVSSDKRALDFHDKNGWWIQNEDQRSSYVTGFIDDCREEIKSILKKKRESQIKKAAAEFLK